MKRIPSYLKGLAETRARLAGDIERYERFISDTQKILDTARLEKEACDRLIQKFDGRLDPDKIEPVYSNNPAYGTRGKLKDAILRCVAQAYPGEVTTTEIVIALQLEFGLDLVTPAATKLWVDNSVRPQLKKLVKEGIVARGHEASPAAVMGRWRLEAKND